MKKALSLICVALMLIGVILACPVTMQAASVILPTDVSEASADCTLVGIQGSYIVEAQSAINRINALRKEACRENVRDPRNSNRFLTMDDYVPISWSSDLEYVARIRAAEASVITDHTRANGDSCWSIESENGISGNGEILAWNFSKSMLAGIEQWYSEKYDWVNQTGGVTGHYTQMIDPSNLYIGLGTFYSTDGAYPSCTAGRLSSGKNLDTTVGQPISNCIQTIEIEKASLSALYLRETSGNQKFYAGNSVKYQPVYTVHSDFGSSCVLPLEDIKWESSAISVATVSDGKVDFLKAGKTTITAGLASGETASVALTVTPPPKKSQQMTAKSTVKNIKATALKKKKQSIKKAVTVKKAQGTVTYIKVKSGTTAKIYNKITVNKKNGNITLKKGTYSKGTYNIRVKITAAGNANYKSSSKTVTVKIKVK